MSTGSKSPKATEITEEEGKEGEENPFNSITPYDKFTALRGVVVNEDNLINHRFTWLLLIQGLLGAGIANETIQANTPTAWLLAFIGATLSFFFGLSIKGAIRSIVSCRKKWEKVIEAQESSTRKELKEHLPEMAFETKWWENYTVALCFFCFVVIPLFWFFLNKPEWLIGVSDWINSHITACLDSKKCGG